MSKTPPSTDLTTEATDRTPDGAASEARSGIHTPVNATVGDVPAVHYPGPRGMRILSMPAGIYLVFFLVVLVAAVTGNLPESMLSGFAVTIVLGGLLTWIGNLFPVVRDFGLPAILCAFIPATLIFAGIMPENAVTVVQNFVDTYGFLDMFIMALIAGTILGMPRTLLIKAGPRFAVPLLGCITLTFLIIGGISALTGYGFVQGMLFIAAPVMAGGLGVGAVPMSEMYATATGSDPASFMGDLISAVVVANVVCILVAGIYSGLGKTKKQLFVGFNGHGQLLRVKGRAEDMAVPEKKELSSYISLGKGLIISAVLFVAGNLIAAYLPFLHPLAWAIILAAAVKIFGLLPKDLEDGSAEWGDMIGAILVPALLVGVSMTYIEINEILVALSDPMFLVLIAATVLTATLTSGTLGWLVKFHFVEAAITPGLVMADTGGSGDVAVLSAANRMHLMPFAALTTRMGGAVTLFLTSLLVPLLATAAG